MRLSFTAAAKHSVSPGPRTVPSPLVGRSLYGLHQLEVLAELNRELDLRPVTERRKLPSPLRAVLG